MTTGPLILGFDTSASHCAAGLWQDGGMIGSRHETMARGQAERLFPLLEELLMGSGVHWRDLTALGVGVGPGNFTGIRISVAAARGLSLALEIPAIGVNCLEAAAFGIPEPVSAVIDARRGRLYVQSFPNGQPTLVNTADFAPRMPITGPAACGLTGFATYPQAYGIAEAITRIAVKRSSTEFAPPAPLYIREADAAPSRELPPVILDAP